MTSLVDEDDGSVSPDLACQSGNIMPGVPILLRVMRVLMLIVVIG